MKPAVHYTIVANPAAGRLPVDERRTVLGKIAHMLRADLHGLDTRSPDELARCARELAERCDVLVVAGGDGTLSLVINTIDLKETALAFLPFGTGNAVTHALRYRGGLPAIAERIRGGDVHDCDLIDCDGRKKAFMASLGLDGAAIRLYEHYRSRGYRGLDAHMRAGLKAAFVTYRPTGATITVDGNQRRVTRLMSLMVVKQPYFGMGLKAVPKARWDDGHLHSQIMASGRSGILAGLATGFTIGNRAGEYRKGERITAALGDPLTLQVDGELGWTGPRFDFRVLKNALRLKH